MRTTELKISEEPLAERVLRQVRSGKLDEPRLLPSAEKRARDVGKKLDRVAAQQGWYIFMAGQAYAVATGEGAREAERRDHGGGAGPALAVGGVAVRARPAGGVRRVDLGRAAQPGPGAAGRAVRVIVPKEEGGESSRGVGGGGAGGGGPPTGTVGTSGRSAARRASRSGSGLVEVVRDLAPPGEGCRDALALRRCGRSVQEDQRGPPALEGGVMTPAGAAALGSARGLPSATARSGFLRGGGSARLARCRPASGTRGCRACRPGGGESASSWYPACVRHDDQGLGGREERRAVCEGRPRPRDPDAQGRRGPASKDRVVPLSRKMVVLRFLAARAAGVEHTTALSGRVGLASELTSRGASTTGTGGRGGWWRTYSAGATAERGAVARYL